MSQDELIAREAITPESIPTSPPSRRTGVLHWMLKYPMVWVLVVLLIVTSNKYPGFWDLVNLQNLLMQNVALIMASIGMTLVIIAGGFDLSVGSIYAAGAVFYLSLDGVLPAYVGVLLTILVGLGCGLINGVLVNVFRINPFIATLGSSSAFTGLLTLYVGANVKFSNSTQYGFIGSYVWLNVIPVSVAIAAVVLITAGVVLAKTKYGRSIYAVGGNKEAARLNGIRVGMISASTFVLIGGLAALGGVFTSSQLGTAQPNFVGTVTLDAIAVVIIGGTSLVGGEGAMWRTAIGLAILAVVNNLFTSLNFDPSLQLLFKGLIVIIAVGVDVWSRRRSAA